MMSGFHLLLLYWGGAAFVVMQVEYAQLLAVQYSKSAIAVPEESQ